MTLRHHIAGIACTILAFVVVLLALCILCAPVALIMSLRGC